MCAVAAGLTLLGHVLIAPPGLHLGYDATFYVRMVEGPMTGVPPPFSFRVLVPWLARLLPLPAPAALLVISYASLFGCYLIIMASCRVAGLRLRDAIVGVVSIWGSTWHLYGFWNPYLTDAFGLLMLAIMMWAVLTGTLWAFAAAAIVGVLARETTAVLVPAWLITRQWRAAIAVAGGTLAVAALPRILMQPSIDAVAAAPALSGDQLQTHPIIVLRQIAASWGIVWLFAIAGIACLPGADRRRLGAVFIALLAGALAASAVATDLGRMFAFLAPVLAIGCAQLYAVLRRARETWLAAAMIVMVAVQWRFNAPDVVIVPSSWMAGWPRRAFVIAELLLALAIVGRLAWRAYGASRDRDQELPRLV